MVKTDEYRLHELLKKIFGFDSFKGKQEAIIKSVLNGQDTFVIMPTGGGKSLCYQLPSLIMEGTAIVISPLIALMKNQVDAMRSFSLDDGVAHIGVKPLGHRRAHLLQHGRRLVDPLRRDVEIGGGAAQKHWHLLE